MANIDSLLAYYEDGYLFLLHKRKMSEWGGSDISQKPGKNLLPVEVTNGLSDLSIPFYHETWVWAPFDSYFSPCGRQTFSVVKLAMTSHTEVMALSQ